VEGKVPNVQTSVHLFVLDRPNKRRTNPPPEGAMVLGSGFQTLTGLGSSH
jgi:hypothetical protein